MTNRMLVSLVLSGLAGVAALAAMPGMPWWQADSVSALPPSLSQPAPDAAATRAAPGTVAVGPRFDVARIGPRGSAVFAGRAGPGDEVILHDQGEELGRARADSRGEFVILPLEPLAPGTHSLTLRTRDDRGQERLGEEAVMVVVPGAAPRMAAAGPGVPAGEAPLVVLLPAPGTSAAPRVLQGAVASGTGRLGLDIVDYDEAGVLRFSGSAPAGGTVRLYVDGRHAGDAAVDPGGRWSLQPEPEPVPGRHTLRLDQIGPQGRVAARLELPFLREAAASVALAGADGRFVVQPGANLWRIARATYGRGIRYTDIHRANADQIRDPALIYPGQIFELPNP
jgi:nucleoid-associated protein YgaU